MSFKEVSWHRGIIRRCLIDLVEAGLLVAQVTAGLLRGDVDQKEVHGHQSDGCGRAPLRARALAVGGVGVRPLRLALSPAVCGVDAVCLAG